VGVAAGLETIVAVGLAQEGGVGRVQRLGRRAVRLAVRFEAVVAVRFAQERRVPRVVAFPGRVPGRRRRRRRRTTHPGDGTANRGGVEWAAREGRREGFLGRHCETPEESRRYWQDGWPVYGCGQARQERSRSCHGIQVEAPVTRERGVDLCEEEALPGMKSAHMPGG